MAAPYVTGVAALLVGRHPKLTAAQVVQRSSTHGQAPAGLRGRVISGGIVDAAGALLATPAVSVASVAPTVLPPDTIHAMLLTSDEYYAIHGANPLGYVQGLYQDLLGRDVDPAGAYYWVGQLLNGASRGAVALAITGSPEAQETKIARWFQGELGRTQSLEVPRPTRRSPPGP